ncbi:fimbrial protein [Klebsiella sp. T2.Ur]|nr:fimbrial protein [Klebsiella sp. T2.Ur]
MSSNKLLYVIFFIFFFGTSFDTMAYVEGEMRPNGGTHEFIASLGTLEFGSNTIGSKITKPFSIGGSYGYTTYCTQHIGPGASYFKSDSNLPVSPSSGFFSLSEYVDVSVKFYVWGRGNVTIPFSDTPNIDKEAECNPPSQSINSGAVTGGSGEITFILKKPIVNGLMIHSTGVAEIWGRTGNVAPNSFGDMPVSRLTISNTIITAQDKCTINNGNPINIEFGTIPNTSKQLNGVNYQQNMQVPIECTGGGFDGNSSVEFAVQPASGVSAFNSDYLATSGTVDRSNLAIAIKDRAGHTVTPNHFYTVPSVSNTNGYKGTWNLVAAPVANQGATIPEGDFEASATIVARFQ